MDKLLLRKRAIVETIIDQLKNVTQIEHSRHRSVVNYFRGHRVRADRLHLLGEAAVRSTSLNLVGTCRKNAIGGLSCLVWAVIYFWKIIKSFFKIV